MQDALKKMDSKPAKAQICYRKGDPWKEERSKAAWKLNPDKLMLMTFTGEGDWDEKKRSYAKGANGHYDYGICQVNSGYHSKVTKDPRFKDWKWQLEQCVRLYKGGTVFYAKEKILKSPKHRKKMEALIVCE